MKAEVLYHGPVQAESPRATKQRSQPNPMGRSGIQIMFAVSVAAALPPKRS
jgi:hypothetical protein